MSLRNGKCDRCKQPTQDMVGSFFNTDMLCETCQDREIAHPDYAKAKEIEFREVRNGNMNFPGIGLPKDLT